MTHSDCIKFGLILENILRELISTILIDIKESNKKNKRERDHLFIDNVKGVVHYAELKSNLCLDTEKIVSTNEKISDISKELTKLYPEYKLTTSLVCLRYVETIPENLKKKYPCGITSVNEYLSNTGCSIKFTEEEYIHFLNYIAKKMK